MQRFARRKLNYFRLNALKSKRIMQEPSLAWPDRFFPFFFVMAVHKYQDAW